MTEPADPLKHCALYQMTSQRAVYVDKVKFTLEQAMKAHTESTGIALLFL
jgi:hypothetical protein